MLGLDVLCKFKIEVEIYMKRGSRLGVRGRGNTAAHRHLGLSGDPGSCFTGWIGAMSGARLIGERKSRGKQEINWGNDLNLPGNT